MMTVSKGVSIAGLFALVLTTGIVSGVNSRVDTLPQVDPPGTWFLLGPLPPAPPTGILPGRPSARGIGWQVIDYVSAHGVLIVNVETDRLEEANGIARTLVDPLKDGYVEVLVYFRRAGMSLADERVQWTPTGGYIETDLSLD